MLSKTRNRPAPVSTLNAPTQRELNSAARYKASSQWVGTLGESAADKKTFESSEQLKSAAAVVGAPADIMASLAQRGMDESPTSVLEPTDKRKPDQKPARSLWSLSVFDYGSPQQTKTLPRRDSFEELGQDPASPRTPPAVALSPVAPAPSPGSTPFDPLACYRKQWGARPSPEQQRATADGVATLSEADWSAEHSASAPRQGRSERRPRAG